MSGKPYPEGVGNLRETLTRIRELEEEAARLNREVAERNARLKAIDEEYTRCIAAVTESMAKMDVASNHNAGWERRVVWFLAELNKQAEIYGRTHQ